MQLKPILELSLEHPQLSWKKSTCVTRSDYVREFVFFMLRSFTMIINIFRHTIYWRKVIWIETNIAYVQIIRMQRLIDLWKREFRTSDIEEDILTLEGEGKMVAVPVHILDPWVYSITRAYQRFIAHRYTTSRFRVQITSQTWERITAFRNDF